MSIGVFSSLKRKATSFITRIERVFCFDESRVIYNGKSYASYWEGAYGNHNRSFISNVRLRAKVKRAFIKDGFRPDEFSLYGLEFLSKRERNLFLSRQKKDQILISFYGSKWREILRVLKDKYVFYTYLKSFFKRDVTYIKSNEDRLSFLSFCALHHSIFAKLNRGNCGNGARSFSISNDEHANKVFDELIRSGEWIIEELIVQESTLSAFNSSSINTVRFPSFKKNGVVECVYPCMRFGRVGSIVDNAGQGGVFVSIDQKTGEIISDAYDERGNVFILHPDSKVAFRGFRIPQWANLIELVKKAHLALPDDQVYVAFDFALSDKGWCIVEGNWGDWILQQVSLKKGFKNEFVSLLNGSR
jgi:hypothetical protein